MRCPARHQRFTPFCCCSFGGFDYFDYGHACTVHLCHDLVLPLAVRSAIPSSFFHHTDFAQSHAGCSGVLFPIPSLDHLSKLSISTAKTKSRSIRTSLATKYLSATALLTEDLSIASIENDLLFYLQDRSVKAGTSLKSELPDKLLTVLIAERDARVA